MLFSQIGFSQNTDVNKLLIDGENAFSENNFNLAKNIYTNITTLDSSNKLAWYNLAISELKLGEQDNACEHFYKVYLLNDGGVLFDIKKYCPNFRNGTIVWLSDVDETPKFIYQENEYLLIDNKNINPVYLEILRKEVGKSRILKEKGKGKIYMEVHINELGIFDGKVLKVGAKEEDEAIVKMEVLRIFRSMVSYSPAKHNGKSVNIWEKWALPIDFGN